MGNLQLNLADEAIWLLYLSRDAATATARYMGSSYLSIYMKLEVVDSVCLVFVLSFGVLQIK